MRLANRPIRRLSGLSALVSAGALSLVLGSCMPGFSPGLMSGYLPASMRGLQSGVDGEVWLALPLGAWLGPLDGAGEPETIVACIGPQCPARLAAGIFRLTGEAARRAERDLRDSRALVARVASAPEAEATGEAFAHAGLTGFTLTIAARSDRTRAIHAAALGRREGADLRVALVLGDDAAVVRAAAIQIADGAMGGATGSALSARP